MPCLHLCRDSMRQDENESEKGMYIGPISHAFDLFLSHFVAPRNMSVNHTRVKGHECLASLLKLVQLRLVALIQECECLYSRIPCLIHNSLKVSFSTFNKCKPGMRRYTLKQNSLSKNKFLKAMLTRTNFTSNLFYSFKFVKQIVSCRP